MPDLQAYVFQTFPAIVAVVDCLVMVCAYPATDVTPESVVLHTNFPATFAACALILSAYSLES
ncbi:MAG TPA: hypothetical protein VJ742_00610, partial [Nitrososphaera sp.]|nr:hypothetical protein [Nitrososphaera sp.]